MAEWKAKEYYTILLGGIPADTVGSFLRETIGLCEDTLITSHFYTEKDGDFAYTDALDLDAYFAERSSASFHLQALRLDRAYHSGSCVIYADGTSAELECDIEETDFDTERLPELQAWLIAQLQDGIAEYASISYTFDNKPLFEIRKGELQ